MTTRSPVADALLDLQSSLHLVTEEAWGHPVDAQKVARPAEPRDARAVAAALGAGRTQDLVDLYLECDGVSLPDVWVGYFIDSLARVVKAPARGEPVEVRGSVPRSVLMFGSDGGGGRFVLDRASGEILHLFSEGELRGGIFFDERDFVRPVASSVEELIRSFTAELRGQAAGERTSHFGR